MQSPRCRAPDGFVEAIQYFRPHSLKPRTLATDETGKPSFRNAEASEIATWTQI
jgi:hypothetical protein